MSDGTDTGPAVVIGSDNHVNNQQVDSNDGKNSGAVVDNKGTPDLLSAFSNEDNRKYAEQKGWKDHDSLLKSYRDLEAAYSKGKTAQPDNSQQQQVNVAEREVPTAPTEYEFKLPEGFPQDGAYDKSLAELFRG